VVRQSTTSGILSLVGIAGLVLLFGVGLGGSRDAATTSPAAATTTGPADGSSRIPDAAALPNPAAPDSARRASVAALAHESAEALIQQFRRPPPEGDRVDPFGSPDHPREFFFTRAVYSSTRGWGMRGGSWRVDYPKADIQFLWGLRRLSNIDAYEGANAVQLTDPELRRYPFLYALEVGYMRLSEPEVQGLRDYLEAGGFLMIDDFWGTYEWSNFEWQIQQVLPEHRVEELPLSHELFRTFYEIDEVVQVPGVRHAWYGTPTWENDGYVPHVRAIKDDDGRIMVVINWNTDLGDAWEWAEDPYYPLEKSTYAYQIAVNTIIYAMSH